MTLLPGATIGIIGNNLVSWRIAQAARNTGYLVAMYLENADTRQNTSADYIFIGRKDWESFVNLSAIVIYNDLGLPFELVSELDQLNLPQGTMTLDLADDLSLSRSFFDEHAINILPYKLASTLDEIALAATALSYPVAVKPIFKHAESAETVILSGAWDLGLVAPLIDGGQLLVETWLEDAVEYRASVVRDANGNVINYPLTQIRRNSQHQVTQIWLEDGPTTDVIEAMQQTIQQIARPLDYVGAFYVTFLYSTTGNLYVGDIFPGIGSEQFVYSATMTTDLIEQHLRVLTGQALKPTRQHSVAIYRPMNDEEISRLYPQWAIKPNWQITIDTEKNEGYVIASGEQLVALEAQMAVADIWID
ncbi:ATP-grasp domain-containing protein [Weissella diestrammenae]|uniref:ATP-grasp domain-containing protein n=1 Tax=Weissella diestrammenae TaxID=1162633 RepID=A0A7G9T657_9LACO|nr:ATP-grasp domain-containing protein [Weissella diestrammenae]MCM0582422.1 ATP-grasp domain-containing protein [Weissella diestrammenae]QNN75582.1 ATP-grasp domain-containing protein [Weissella diestrammenae]